MIFWGGELDRSPPWGARPYNQYSTSSRLCSVGSIATIVDEKQNSPFNKSNETVYDSSLMHDNHTYWLLFRRCQFTDAGGDVTAGFVAKLCRILK